MSLRDASGLRLFAADANAGAIVMLTAHAKCHLLDDECSSARISSAWVCRCVTAVPGVSAITCKRVQQQRSVASRSHLQPIPLLLHIVNNIIVFSLLRDAHHGKVHTRLTGSRSHQCCILLQEVPEHHRPMNAIHMDQSVGDTKVSSSSNSTIAQFAAHAAYLDERVHRARCLRVVAIS